MNNLHVKTGDNVMVISGKCKGKTGKVLQTSPKEGKVIVEGLNMVTKHVKPRRQGEQGGIVKAEGAIYACKVMPVCPKCGKATRVGHSVKDGKTDLDAMASQLDKKPSACLYLQSPNFFGQLEEMEKAAEMIHSVGAKLIAGCNPIALGLLKTPAEQGADIAVGEGQPLGMPLSFGGPYLGFMAATQAMMRKLPGRIVGETVDVDGKRAFVLTLQAREQHIRREKASSNICSNQALCALTASVYLATVGPDGLKQAASLCYQKAHYLAQQLCSIPGVSLRYSGTFFHEFVTDQKDSDKLLSALEQQGILGGYPLTDGGILWCATEKNTKEEMDRVVEIIRKELM